MKPVSQLSSLTLSCFTFWSGIWAYKVDHFQMKLNQVFFRNTFSILQLLTCILLTGPDCNQSKIKPCKMFVVRTLGDSWLLVSDSAPTGEHSLLTLMDHRVAATVFATFKFLRTVLREMQSSDYFWSWMPRFSFVLITVSTMMSFILSSHTLVFTSLSMCCHHCTLSLLSFSFGRVD